MSNGWMVANCPPSSEWKTGGNTGKANEANKGTTMFAKSLGTLAMICSIDQL